MARLSARSARSSPGPRYSPGSRASFPIERLVDTTGAGDLFAAGFLAGLVRGCELRDAAHLGGLAAAEVIQHYGARPNRRLSDLAAESGFTLSL